MYVNPLRRLVYQRIMLAAKRDFLKKKHLPKKRSFEGNCETLRAISQPRTLFSDIPASQKGVYLFYDPLIIFFISNKMGEKEKLKQEVSELANDANKHMDWLIFLMKL